MTGNRHAAILWGALLIAVVAAVFSGKMQAQSRRVPDVPSAKQTPTPPAANIPATSTSGWDYRILSGPLSSVSNTPSLRRRDADSLPTSSRPAPSHGRSLEERIRELAEQGYEVQSFNVVPPACNGVSREFEGEGEVIVLLRRMKK